MANKPELSIKVSVDPVINQTKFQEDINKLIPESNPVKINGKFDAAKMLDGISDYQKGGKNAVTIHGKIDAAEALKSIAKYQEGGQNQAVILGKFTNVKEMLNDFKNETAEINASLTQDSLSNIRDQLQGIINGLDVSKVGSASSEPSKKKPVKGNEKQISVDVTPGTTDESIDILRSKIQNGLTEIPITANISPVQLNAIRKSVTDILADITFDPTVKKVNSASQTTTKKKKIDFPSEDRLSEMMANAQYTATKTESAEAASAKQKNIIYQNLVDHQAKAAESANSATAQTAQGLSDANKAMGDLNTKAEEFEQNWRQVVTLIANATKNLANLMKDNYGGSFGLDIFSSFQEFQKELPDLDTDHVKPYLKTIKDWGDLLLESAGGEFNPDIMIQAIHMLSGLADAWNQIDVAKLTNNQTKEKLLQNMSELNSIFPSSGDKEPFLGEKDAAINYLTDLLAKAAKYYAEVGNAVKQTADSIAVANEGFANQTTELKKTNSELERTKQLSFDSPELVVPGNDSTKVDDTKPVDLHGKVTLTADNVIPPETPIDIPGKVTLTDKDITVPDKIDLNGNLVIKNATKEIKSVTKEAEAEVSKESKKASKKDAGKEKQRKKKEYLLALGSLLKKNANTQNELSDMYPGAPDHEELQDYIKKLHRRTGTTVDLLDTLVGRDGWKNDVLYTSAVEDSMHIRSRKKAGDKTSETLKAGIAEEKEYVSILEKIPDLEKSATKALADFGIKSVHYQDANKKLTDAKDTIGAFEQKYGEAYSDLLRSEVIEQQNFSKAMAQEKAIRDAQLAQEEEANKKRIADEKKYLSLLTQETKDHQTALEVQREYGDKDFRTQYAMEDWQKSNTDLKTLEATVKKQSGSLSNVPDYNEIVEKNRRSWMQWGQDQQDISAKQRAADLKDNTSLLNNYNKALETQAKLLQGLYKIDQSKDPGGYAAKQIALQSNAINVTNLRKDIKSRGLNGEAAYTDANAKYLAGINAANLTKAQKAKEATDKAATNAKKKQDEWLKSTESTIKEAEKKYIDGFKAIREEQDDLSKTSDQQAKNDINSRIAQKQAEMDNAKKVLDSYNSTANGLVQEAWGRIDYQTKGFEIQDQIAYEAKSGKEAAATKKENLDLLKQYNQSLNEELKLLKQVYVAETAEGKAAAQNALNDQRDKTENLRKQLKGKGLDVTPDYQKYNTQNSLNEAAINAKYNGTSIEDLKNTYIKNLREREANINAAYSTEDADKIARITQRIEDNNKAIQEAGFALTQFGQKANNAWAEISKVNDELDITAEQKFNKALELQTKQTDAQAKKAISDNEKLLNRIERAMRNQEKVYSDYQSSEDNTQDKETKLGRLNIRNEELKGLRQQAGTRGLTVTQEYLTLEKQHREEILGIDEALQKRAQAEQEAIRVQDEDRISLLNYIKTVEKYKDRLEQDNHTDDTVYGDSVKMANASWDLLSELNKNPNDKNQVANLWGQKYGIQGVTDLESAFKALAVEAGKAGIKVQDLRTETEKLRSVTQAKTNIANLKSQLIDYLEKFPKVEKTLAEPVQKLKAALADPNAYKNAGQLKQALAELRAQAKSLGLESENLIDKFEKLFGQHLSTMITMAALHKMQDALRIVYQNVVEIDTAMTELRKVTNETDSAYAKFMENAADRAQRVGATMSDTITATADFARLGYSLEDASSISDAALIYKNVGDGISDISAASESLISTMQAFNVEAKNSMKIVDEFNEAGNNFAISSAGVGEALQRSGAALASANNTMEQSIALATTMNRVVQNPEIVGTTLKTVSMYLRSTKADLEAAGESTEGMAETTSKLRDSLKALSHGKVDIFDEVTKQYKSTTDIIIEMGKAWDSMSDKEQAAALELMGGKRNANALSSLIENYQEIEKVIDTVSRASGSAESENQKYLSSINGRLTELDSSFQALSQDVLSSDLVKTGVSFLTSIVKLLDQIVNLTGALPLGLGIGAFVTQLGEPKMTGFMIVPSNTPGGDTEQARCSFYWRSAAREYLVKPTNMVA